MLERADFEATGRAWIRNAIPPADLKQLANNVHLDGRAGDRPATNSPIARYFGHSNPVSDIAAALGLDPGPVRLATFDKSMETNWTVPWHQDRVIAVAERHAVSGYTNWLRKDGYWHVEPPADVLKDMVFLRLHIDAANESNGCLQIAIGSHRAGRVPSSETLARANAAQIETCRAAPGDVLIVKALVLHRSAPSKSAASRRAIRIDYADRTILAPPLRWALAA